MTQNTRTFVASAQRLARSGGVVKDAFLPARSVSLTPRARAQPPHMWIVMAEALIFSISSRNGGSPSGTTEAM